MSSKKNCIDVLYLDQSNSIEVVFQIEGLFLKIILDLSVKE